MDRKKIITSFGEDEKVDVLNLYDKYELAKDKDITVFGNGFTTPNIWKSFERNFNSKYFSVDSYGFFQNAERRMISFNNVYDLSYPMKILKIKNTSKFNNPTHKDYLGAIMGLGIKRNKIGDLLLKDNCCYVPICEEIEEFIVNNLTAIGKAPCKIEILEEYVIPPSPEYKEEIILVQSLRIDSIVSKLCRISRGNAQKAINEGRVLVDYNRINDKSKEIESGERITIRGVGKFILGDIIGNSKSGKCRVVIKKYT